MVWSGDFHCFVRQHSDEVPKVAHPMPWFAGLVIEQLAPDSFATAAALPALEPPVMQRASHGLRAAPCSERSPVGP